MKRFLTICICVFLCVGCTHQGGGNTGTCSTSETVVTTTTPVTTPVVDIPMPKYHEKLMSGDFSAIAGEYINSEGYIMKINNEGLRTNEAEHGEVTYANGMYQMPITRRLGTNNTYTLTVYPVGLDLSSEALDTDTSKIRIHYGNSDPVSEEEVFTRIEHDTLTPPEYHEQIMSGNFSAVAGEYVNPEGKTFVLDVTGLSEGEVSSGSVRGSFTKGYAMSVGAVGAVDGLYSLFLYPVGVEITYFDGYGYKPLGTDTSKVRIYYGQAEPMSINEIYTRVENSQVDVSSYEMKMGYKSYDCSKSGLEIFGVKMEEDSNYFQIVLNPDGDPWDDLNFAVSNDITTYYGEFRRKNHDRFSVELGKFTDKHINPDPSAEYKEDRAEFYFRLVDDKLYYLSDDIPWEEWDTYTSENYCVLKQY